MKTLIRIDQLLSKVVQKIVGAMLFLIMALLFMGVIARYFFNSPIIWVDELVTYLLVCMTFLGGYLALRSDKLVRVTFVLSVLPPKVQRAVDLFAQLVVCAFLATLGYYAITMLASPVALTQKTVALRMPMMAFYLLIPVMIAMMLIRMVINIYTDAHPEAGKEEGP